MSTAKVKFQHAKMATRDDDAATVILATTELKPPMMDWLVEAVQKEFSVKNL